jgi:Type II CAAX prenyl endopeptidase Rce1-like
VRYSYCAFQSARALLSAHIATLSHLGEEIGWRAFALPRLLATLEQPVVANLFLGLVWGLWHVPTCLLPGQASFPIALFLLLHLCFWLFFGTIVSFLVPTYRQSLTRWFAMASARFPTRSRTVELWQTEDSSKRVVHIVVAHSTCIQMAAVLLSAACPVCG